MTLILTEGFETYRGTGDMVAGAAGRWTSVSGGTIGGNGNRTGTYCIQASTGVAMYRQLTSGEKHTKLAAGAFLRINGTGTDLIRFMGDAGATEHVVLRHVGNGQLAIDRGATQLAISGLGAINSSSGGNFIELVATLDDTVGTINVYIDGAAVPVLTFTGDTKNAGTDPYFDGVYFQLPNGGNVISFDDIYILSGAGSAPYNDRLGEIRCWPLLPNGDGASSVLLGSDGNSVNNYLLVDEGAASVSAGDYAGSANPGDKDTYAYQNLTPTTGTVMEVNVATFALKSDAGTKQFRPVVRHAGVDYGGDDKNLGTSLNRFLQSYALNPGTGAGWTIADVNAAEFGFEVRT